MIYRVYVKEINKDEFYCFSGEIRSLKWAESIKNTLDFDDLYEEVEIRGEE